MAVKYDFSGYATRNDLRCSDGRVIRKNAFKDCDGTRVPLVWNHQHDDVSNVIGFADLQNVSDGVIAHCAFNNTEKGRDGKECVKHGDVVSLSIYANQLKQVGADVMHGMIREVSLVLAGANPGAYIEEVLSHGDEEGLFSAEIYSDQPIELYHSEDNAKEEKPMAEEKKDEKKESGKTIGEIVDSMTDEQKEALYALVGMAAEGAGADEEEEDGEDNNEGGSEMKHNAFDSASNGIYTGAPVDMALIHSAAKKVGSYKQAINDMIENGELTHAMTVPMEGMTGPSQATANQTYGFV